MFTETRWAVGRAAKMMGAGFAVLEPGPGSRSKGFEAAARSPLGTGRAFNTEGIRTVSGVVTTERGR